MACYNPLKAFDTFEKSEKGKPIYRITPYKIDHVEKLPNGQWLNCVDSFTSPFNKIYRKFTVIPCGKCIGCRVAYSREWANRLMLELKYHKDAWFVTLTYDDDHIPVITHPVNGEWHDFQTLEKRDLQLFMKRLRVNYERSGYGSDEDYKIRFYAAGEYGTSTLRPHYHIIIYGLKLPEEDIKLYKTTLYGCKYYNSKLIEKSWTFGYSVIGKVTWNSCAYVARYCTKKIRAPDEKIEEFFQKDPRQQEFVLMSRKPGIAYQYFQENKDHIYEFDKIIEGNEDGQISCKPPHYFDKLYDLEDPELLVEVKDQRKENAERKVRMIENKGLDYLEYLKTCRESFLKKNKMKLRRNKV